MKWIDELRLLYEQFKWREAIDLLIKEISQNNGCLDLYLNLMFLLREFLLEAEYTSEENEYYSKILLVYFKDSYQKYNEMPEYLFFVGTIASVSEWYFELDVDDIHQMLLKACKMEPDNIMYQWVNFYNIPFFENDDHTNFILYLKKVKKEFNNIELYLKKKSLIGDEITQLFTYWFDKLNINM